MNSILANLRDSMRLALLCLTLLVLGAGQVLADEPVQGGTFNVILEPEPSTLSGAFTSSDPTSVVSSKIHDGLLTYDPEFNLKPQLASSWDVSADGKTITFHLREGVKWHDGVEFTSADVAFSLMLMKEVHPRGRGHFAEINSIETPDPYTAVLKLNNPAPYMMWAFVSSESPMVPKHLYETGEHQTNPNNVAPIGTGPFKFVEWVKGSHITLERNPDYWDAPRPYLDKVVFHIIPDSAARAVALETGEVDMGYSNPVPLSDIDRLLALPHLNSSTLTNRYTAVNAWIEFNLENEYFKHLEVRQAIAHAIDREFIRDNVWFGHAAVSTGPIHVDLAPYYTADVPTYEYDLDKANSLLDEAGFPRGSDGVRFSVTHDYMPFGDPLKVTAEYIKQALKAVGIAVTIRSQDYPTYARRVYELRDFDFTNVVMNNTPDPSSGVQRIFWSKNFKPGVPWSNGSGYSNPEMDHLLESAAIEVDPEKRVEIWHDMQRLAQEDIPDVPLVSLKSVTIFNTKVKNLFVNPLGYLSSFSEVYLAK